MIKMKLINLFFLGLFTLLIACQNKTTPISPPSVQVSSAMKNVMWKGELAGKLQLDSLVDQGSTYGLGPLEYLQGELLLFNGKAFVSKVTSDSTMEVFQDQEAKAPFFVYSQVPKWVEVAIPDSLHNIAQLEAFLSQQTQKIDHAFAFKLKGKIESAEIHIQNLPAGTEVSSPTEAHQGQVNYKLGQEDVNLLGFFSSQHQGVFTHHDTYVHLHLITTDLQKMGHLDAVRFSSSEMTLYLPEGLLD